MKRLFSASPLLVLLFALLSLSTFTGCCDGTVIISGIVTDANTGARLDSVQVSLYINEKREIDSYTYAYSDSTGSFLLWGAGFCKNTQIFILATKLGYRSQDFTIESTLNDLDIKLQPD